MAETVDLEAAHKILVAAWDEIGASTRPPARMQELIETVLNAPDVTFKYILITGYLGKATNRRVHARALQTNSSLPGAYDARSLCHKVVVGFEKSKGNLFGLSNEPFVNKPARHPEHDGENPQLRNRGLSRSLHLALEQAQTAKRENVYLGLVHILRTGLQHASNEKQVRGTGLANFGKVTAFIGSFLEEADGGARLVAVWGTFVKLLSEKGQVKVYPPSASDFFGKTVGDVEVFYDGVLVSASECKQRPINSDDIQHGIKKALQGGVPEYHFVLSAGVVVGQESLATEIVEKFSGQIDLRIIDIWTEAPLLAAALNPIRRGKFGMVTVQLLREMRKFESANKAVEIWNELRE
ncbi:MAG: restriction endonuclease, SacI family [Candidatus Acidiferrales bacterium]